MILPFKFFLFFGFGYLFIVSFIVDQSEVSIRFVFFAIKFLSKARHQMLCNWRQIPVGLEEGNCIAQLLERTLSLFAWQEEQDVTEQARLRAAEQWDLHHDR